MMSERTTELPDGDLHSLTGAFALDSLDEVEQARYQRHLRTCVECQAEVGSFVETVGRLGGAQPTVPPPGMRDAVLARVARTRQLPPQVESGRVATRRRAPRWLAGVAAAGLLLGGVGAGLTVVSAQRDAERAERLTAAVSQVLNTPGREMVEAPMAGGRATVVTAGDQVVFLGEGLDAPPSNDVYVLWTIDAAGTPRSAGALVRTGDGTFVAAAEGYHAGEDLAVTVEPHADVTAPTGDVVMTTA